MMPEMDGFTLLEKVKSDDRFCSIPFVLLTARADINDKLRGLRIGVDDYMTKPFEVEELLLRIKNLIKNTKSRQLVVVSEQLDDKKHKTFESSTVNHQPSTIDIQWLEKIETIAKREISNSSFKVEDLAAELLMSRSQLFRKIKAIAGLTPKQYIRSVRLHEAKRLLETGNIYTLKEVAYSVGFENTTHFANHYEKAFGKRPHALLVGTM